MINISTTKEFDPVKLDELLKEWAERKLRVDSFWDATSRNIVLKLENGSMKEHYVER